MTMRRERTAEEEKQWDAWKAAFVQAGMDGWNGKSAVNTADNRFLKNLALAQEARQDKQLVRFCDAMVRMERAMAELKQMQAADMAELQAKWQADIPPAEPPASVAQQPSAHEAFEQWAAKWWRTDAEQAYAEIDEADSDDEWLEPDCYE